MTKNNIDRLIFSICANAHAITENTYIAINNQPYPDFGVAVVMTGAPASAKSSVVKNQLLVNGKVINIDDFMLLYLAWVDWRYDRTTDEKERRKMLKPFKGRKLPKEEKDLTSEDVEIAHNATGSRGRIELDEYGKPEWDEEFDDWKRVGYDKEAMYTFLDANRNARKLPNIIIDMTGKNERKLIELVNRLKEMNYYTVMVTTVTSRDTSIKRNLERDRSVPTEVVEKIFDEVWQTVPRVLKNGALANLDEAWLTFSEDFTFNIDKTMTFQSEKERRRYLKGFKYFNTAWKLEKIGNSFQLSPDIAERFAKTMGFEF